MADIVSTPDKTPTNQTSATSDATVPKITLLFTKPHNHNGVQYNPGDREKFTQTDADAIRAHFTAETVANP